MICRYCILFLLLVSSLILFFSTSFVSSSNNNRDIYVLQQILAPILIGEKGDDHSSKCSEIWNEQNADLLCSGSISARVKCDENNNNNSNVSNNRITYLDLSDCGLAGTLPDEFTQLSALKYLYLNSNSLTGQIPNTAWSNMTSLIKLYLNKNKLSGTLPPLFSNLVSLTHLELSKNSKIVGTLPTSWRSLKNMKYLELGYLALEGELVSEWVEMSSLQQLSIRYCPRLGGRLPVVWGTGFKNMKKLRMQGNMLEGEIPESYGDLGSNIGLDQLSLHSNKLLSGSLPHSFSKFTKLQKMWLYGNKFSGELPPSWSSMKKLKLLVLNSLEITGSLPESWSQMTSLQTLDLRDNKLTGDSFGSGVPPSWKSLKNLLSVDLSGNCVPPSSFSSSSSSSSSSTSLPASSSSSSSTQISQTTGDSNFTFTVIPTTIVASETSTAGGENDDVAVHQSGLDEILSAPSLLLFDFTPGCMPAPPPADTKVSMSSPYRFRRVNSWNWQDHSACIALFKDRKCDKSPFNIEVDRWGDGSFRLAFYCSSKSLTFQTSCITSLFVPTLECFLDANATIPCDSTTLPFPSWQNKLTTVPALPSGKLFFTEIKDALLYHGVLYRMIFKLGFNFYNKSFVEVVKLSELFQAKSCEQQVVVTSSSADSNETSSSSSTNNNNIFDADEEELIDRSGSIAINYSTSCISCPKYAYCDGTTETKVGSIPAWRISSNLLPFYPCPHSVKIGCQRRHRLINSTSSSSDNNSITHIIPDGTGCAENYEGTFCSRCSSGYRKSNGKCEKCLALPEQIAFFCIGVGILLLGAPNLKEIQT